MSLFAIRADNIQIYHEWSQKNHEQNDPLEYVLHQGGVGRGTTTSFGRNQRVEKDCSNVQLDEVIKGMA